MEWKELGFVGVFSRSSVGGILPLYHSCEYLWAFEQNVSDRIILFIGTLQAPFISFATLLHAAQISKDDLGKDGLGNDGFGNDGFGDDGAANWSQD
jgi:hypothetical protein